MLRILRVLAYAMLILLAIPILCEIGLIPFTSKLPKYVWEVNRDRHGPLHSKYRQFTKEYLHPLYYFAMTTDTRVLNEINNDVVSVNEYGFRGEPLGKPFQGQHRALGFLLGGSVAFGQGATSNETTISGIVNHRQAKFQIVNGGQPSWNSNQELLKFLFELQAYRPSLIINFSSNNDNLIEGLPYGANEGFVYLNKWVTDIRSDTVTIWELKAWEHLIVRTIDKYFYRTKKVVDLVLRSDRFIYKDASHVAADDDGSKDRTDLHVIANVARNFGQNMEVISTVCKIKGCKHLVVLQPQLFCHPNKVTERNKWTGTLSAYAGFHGHSIVYCRNKKEAIVSELKRRGIDLIDLTSAFDESDYSLEYYFSDPVHLNDSGNDFVARQILERLRLDHILDS